MDVEEEGRARGRGGPDVLNMAMGSSLEGRDGGRGWAARPPWPRQKRRSARGASRRGIVTREVGKKGKNRTGKGKGCVTSGKGG